MNMGKRMVMLGLFLGMNLPLAGTAVADAELGPDALVALAEELVESQAQASELADLAETARQRFEQQRAEGRIDWPHWQDLLELLGPHLSDAAQSQWHPLLAAVAEAPGTDLRGLVHLVESAQAIGHPQPRGLGAAWLTSHESWKQLSPAELLPLGDVLPEDGARQVLADHLQQQYLADPAAARQIPLAHWRGLVDTVGGQLDAATRNQWLDQLNAAFAAEQAGAVLAPLAYDEVSGFAATLAELGDPASARTVVVRWAQAGEPWQAMAQDQPQQFVMLLEDLELAGEPAAALMASIAGHVQATYAAQAGQVGHFTLRQWQDMAYMLAEHLDETERAAFAQQLRAGFAGQIEQGELGWAQLEELREAVTLLDAAQGTAALGDWSQQMDVTALSLQQLADLALGLAEAGEPSLEARQDLATRIEQAYLADAGQIEAVHWGSWVAALQAAMTEAQRQSWREGLRQSFVADGELARRAFESVHEVRAALTQLGDAQAPALTEQWMLASDQWRQVDGEQLGWLAADLGEAGAQGRAMLIEHLDGGIFADATSARQMEPATLQAIHVALGADLDAAQDERWAQVIAAVEDEPLTLAEMSYEQVLELDDEQAPENRWLAWVDSSDRWQQASLGELLRLVDELAASGGGADAALATVADHLQQQHLADPVTARSLSAEQWQRLVEQVADGLDAEARQVWRTQLRSALEGEGLADLERAELDLHVQTLRRLGEPAPEALVAAWVQGSRQWEQAEGRDLLGLLEQLRELGWDGYEGRRQLMAHVHDVHLGSVEAVRELGMHHLNQVVQDHGEVLTADERQQWRESLKGAYQNPAASGVELPEMLAVVQIAGKLGDALPQRMLHRYVRDSDRWQNATDVQVLGQVVEQLRPLGSLSDDAITRILDHLEVLYLQDPQALQAMEPQQWVQLASVAAQGSLERRRRWAQQIESTLAPSQDALEGLDVETAGALVNAVEQLDAPRAEDAAWRYMQSASFEQLQALRLIRLTRLAMESVEGSAEDKRAVLDQLEQAVQTWHAQGSVDVESAFNMMLAWQALGGEPAKVRQWVLVAHDLLVGDEQTRQTVWIHEFERLGEFLFVAHLTGPGHEYPELAETLVTRARHGQLVGIRYPQFLAYPFQDPATRQQLEQGLVDEAGRPYPELARVLAHGHRLEGILDAWTALLEQRVAASEGDMQAMWLVCLGEAVALGESGRTRHRAVLDQALAAAESDAVRLVVAERVGGYFRQAGRPDLGVQLLASIEGQFEGDSRYRLQRVARELEAATAQLAAQEQRRQEEAAVRARQRQLEALPAAIQRAEADGDIEAADRLRQRLEALQAHQ